MNLANKLTLARVCMIPLFLLALMGGILPAPYDKYIAIAIFIIASLTDFLDGYIARSRNMVTNFGKLMDPLADKILVASALIALVELGALRSWIVILIICREFLITGMRQVALLANVETVISADILGKIKTASQMVLIVYLLFDFTGWTAAAIGFALTVATVFFTIASAADYIVKNSFIFKDL